MPTRHGPGGHDTPGRRLVLAAFRVAARLGGEVAPVHLLMAVAEDDDGVLGAKLAPLRPEPVASLEGGSASAGWVFRQTQAAASELAQSRGEPFAPPHLVVAVVDQGDADAMSALAEAGIDPRDLRRLALDQLSAPRDHPKIDLPDATPAGTMNRPPLPIADLDPRVWTVLRWRQAHLPTDRVRSVNQAAALSAREAKAVWRLADRAGVIDDQRYSLLHHHEAAVEAVVAARTGVAPVPVADTGPPRSVVVKLRRHRRLPGFMIGWPSWFANRRVDIRDAWFAVRTAGAYRDQPALRDELHGWGS